VGALPQNAAIRVNSFFFNGVLCSNRAAEHADTPASGRGNAPSDVRRFKFQTAKSLPRDLVVPAEAGIHNPSEGGDHFRNQSPHPMVPAFAGTTKGGAVKFQAHLRVPATRIARVLLRPLAPRRAWGMPGAQRTRSRACSVESTRVSHHGCAEITRHSRTRMVLTVSFVISPVIGLVCHRRLPKMSSANLTPASRRQDHTTSPSASAPFVKSASASIASQAQRS
jgi:hypothetical protein